METTVAPLTQGAAEFAPHIHRLPIELLQHLLSLAVAYLRRGYQSGRNYYRRIAELRLVSTRWLAAIDSHPSFWTLLTNRLSPSLVSIVLEKSGTLPLDVELGLQSYNADPPLHYMNIVTRLAERWRSLNISWFQRNQEEVLRNLLLTPAPQLKAVFFEWIGDILGTVSLFDMAPNLDSISTQCVPPNWTWFLTNGLRKLAVNGILVEVPDFEGLVQALVASPNMEELILSGWRARIGTPGEPALKLEPIILNSLRRLSLHIFPPSWAYKLLEAIRIPQRCAVDVESTTFSPQTPLSKHIEDLQARITGSSSLNVVLEADEFASTAWYTCHGIDGVCDTSISLQYTEDEDLQPSDAFQFWLSALAEITESVQASGIPVHISVSSSFLPHPGSPDTLTSTLKSVDELLPSAYKASFSGSATKQFLSYASSPSFPNLSDLEVLGVQETPWKEILECVSARLELATAQGWKFKPLRSIAVPPGPVDEEIHERLSTLLASMP